MSQGTDYDVRLRYLARMGIDVWQERAQPVVDESQSVTVEASAAVGAQPPPADWDSLRSEVAECHRCALRAGCSQTVFGVGSPTANLMVIGEGPGAEEDRQGEPFVGRAGGLLNNMLKAVGLSRDEVFIANVVKCRPPNNRDPRPEEVAACAPYLLRQIELLQPQVIMAVGRIAAQNLLTTDSPLGRLRRQVHRLEGTEIPVIVTYHPAYLLRSPAEKRKAWDDLKQVRNLLGAS